MTAYVGMQVLLRGLLEACVQVSHRGGLGKGADVSPRIDGFLDTLAELVNSAFSLRRHIMTALRRSLSSRCYALLLIVQVCPWQVYAWAMCVGHGVYPTRSVSSGPWYLFH